jgi:ribonuclease J
VTENLVRFIPLGGLGEIGMNCFALEVEGRLLVVDVGMGFPDDDVGVDVTHPNFTFLYEREPQIDGIFITHGHEDHIGALPYLLRNLKRSPPIYAPPHATLLIRDRLNEHELSEIEVTEIAPGSTTQVGVFQVETIPVAHSIIDATALSITTPVGRIVHTGDFDIDPTQPAGYLTHGERFQELGNLGVRLLLSDSTNVDSPVRKGTEQGVIDALGAVIGAEQGRVILGMFSSNVHRLLGVFAIARATGRRVGLLGRSLNKHYEVAKRLGRLPGSESLLVHPDQVSALPPRETLLIAGGSQGEASSALRRLALDTHQSVRLSQGDVVILSSRIIPGNERKVSLMINDFLRMGVEVKWRATDPELHTSGHAGRSEQQQMIEWVRPRAFIPVHGTLHHMRQHEHLAQLLGVEDTLVVENGMPVRISAEGRLERDRPVPHGITRIAFGGEELDPDTRKRRVELSRNGVAVVALGVSEKPRRIQFGPTFSAFGIPTVDRDPGAARAVRREVERALLDHSERSSQSLEDVVRRAVRRLIQDWTGVSPVVEVHIERLR